MRTRSTVVVVAVVGLTVGSAAPGSAAPRHEGSAAYGLSDGTVSFETASRTLEHAGHDPGRTIRRWAVDTSAGIVYIGADGRTRLAPAVGDEVVLRTKGKPHRPRGPESLTVSRDRATAIWTTVFKRAVRITAYDVPAGRVVARTEVSRDATFGTARVIGASGSQVFITFRDGTWVWSLRASGPDPFRLTNRAGRITSVADGVLAHSGGSVLPRGRRLLGPDWTVIDTAEGSALSADARFVARGFGRQLRTRPRASGAAAATTWTTMRWRHEPLHPIDWKWAPDGHLSATTRAEHGTRVVSCHPTSGHCATVAIVASGRGTPILID